MLDLTKGATALVNDAGQPIIQLKSGVRWRPAKGQSVDLDYILVAVTSLGSGFTVSGNDDEMVSQYDNGAIKHSGNQTGKKRGIMRKTSGEQTESVLADLPRVFHGVTHLVGMVTAADASSFQKLSSAIFSLNDGANDAVLAEYLLPTNAAADTIVAFVAKHMEDGTWTVSLNGQTDDLKILRGDRQSQLSEAIKYAKKA